MAQSTVPQSQPLPGQAQNNAGGFSFQVDDMQRLRRFMVLGSEGGTYYVGEKELGKKNAEAILRLISNGKGCDVVKEVVTYSVEGRTAKQNPVIFVLALCARSDDLATKKAAYEALSKVCRIPTHLFAFVAFCEALSSGSGWGRAHRNAIKTWYLEKPPMSLAMAVTKYQKREGWSHRDLFRLSHVNSDNPAIGCVFKYVIKGLEACRQEYFAKLDDEQLSSLIVFLNAVDLAKECDQRMIVKLIKENGLVREHIPTEHLNSETVRLYSLLLLFLKRITGEQLNLSTKSHCVPCRLEVVCSSEAQI